MPERALGGIQFDCVDIAGQAKEFPEEILSM
jgi:hypothetical protein